MTGRIPFGLLLTLTVLANWPMQAQGQGGPPPGYYGVQPAGMQAYQDNSGQYQGNPNYSLQRTPGPQMPGPPPGMVYEQLPDDLGFTDPDTPLGNYLTNAFRHSWFRGEYLLWNISGPGNVVLGEQTSTGVPNSAAFGGNGSVIGIVNAANNQILNVNGQAPTSTIATGVIYQRVVSSVSGISQTPTLANTTIDGLNGFRGTFGLPVMAGELELGAFVLGQSTSDNFGNKYIQPTIAANPASAIGSPVGTNGLPAVNFQPATFLSQALLVDGVAQPYSSTSSSFIDYDISYHSKLTTSAWGSEVNYVLESPDPGGVVHLRPLVGFRYFNFRDRLNQGGQYSQVDQTNPTGPTITVGREIDSASNNNLYGPQFGMRAEFVQPFFAVGFEPKLTMALNTYNSTLNTSNVLSSSDPAQNIYQGSTTFSPLVDLKAYTNLSLSKNISAFVAYNFLYVANVNRSYNDIVYNKNGTTNQSDFKLEKTMSNATLQGISVGFDVRY